MKLDIKGLIDDCGGPTMVASSCNLALSTVYRWIKTKRMSTDSLCILKNHFGVSIDNYFVGDKKRKGVRSIWGEPVKLTDAEKRTLISLIERST